MAQPWFNVQWCFLSFSLIPSSFCDKSIKHWTRLDFKSFFIIFLYFRMKNSDPVPKLRTRKSVQESGTSGRGRVLGHVQKTRDHHLDVSRNHSSEMSKSSSISNINQVRPRSTSLTRSQSQRLGPRGHVTTSERHVGQPRVSSATVRPRSSTLNSNSSTVRGNFLSESFF